MIIVETGTGNPAANSYESTDGADAYFADRGYTVWADENPLPSRERALILATDLINSIVKAKLAPLTVDQALQWPTEGATGVPRAVRTATAILASRMLSAGTIVPLNPPKDRGIKSTKKTVGKIAVETVYDEAGEEADPYEDIYALLDDVAYARNSKGAIVVASRVIR